MQQWLEGKGARECSPPHRYSKREEHASTPAHCVMHSMQQCNSIFRAVCALRQHPIWWCRRHRGNSTNYNDISLILQAISIIQETDITDKASSILQEISTSEKKDVTICLGLSLSSLYMVPKLK